MSNHDGISGIIKDRRTPSILEHTPRRASGYLVIVSPTGTIEGETLSCVHCQYTWQVEPESRRKRGFCFRCNGATCGKKKCAKVCIPFEQALEKMERRAILLKKADESIR